MAVSLFYIKQFTRTIQFFSMEKQAKYDIALSFAGEEREYVQEVADILKSKGITVFYDRFEEANLWGKNLYEYFSNIYQTASFTIMFISKNYKQKMWTDLERQSMQERALKENQEYILPARFDDTEIPGLLSTIGFVSLSDKSPKDFCEIICQKLITSGRTIPSEEIRKRLPQLVKFQKSIPSDFIVKVKNEKSEPYTDANIFLLADNNTYLNKKTDNKGIAAFKLNVRRKYKLYVACVDCPPYMLDEIDPNENIEISIYTSDNRGSIICERTAYVPGLKGRLNPILDTENRTYLYADNIAINGGEPQPATFKVGVPMNLEDCDGVIMQVTIKDIQGQISLIEFVKPIKS